MVMVTADESSSSPLPSSPQRAPSMVISRVVVSWLVVSAARLRVVSGSSVRCFSQEATKKAAAGSRKSSSGSVLRVGYSENE